MKRFVLTLIAAAVTLFGAATLANAQVKQYSNDLSAFKALVVTGEFEVTVVTGPVYNVVFSVDEPYREYLICDISNQTLTIGVNEKSVPKEVKNLYKGRNAQVPTFKATVSLPDNLQSIKMTGKSVLYNTVETPSLVECTIEATDNAVIKQCHVTAPKITLKADKRSNVLATFSSDAVALDLSGFSVVNVTNENVTGLNITLANAASVVTSGDVKNLSVSAKGTSKAAINGKAEKASFDVNGSADINASNFSGETVSVKMSSLTTLNVTAEKELILDSLNGGASLTYTGDPKVSIKEVVKSTVLHK